MIVRVYKRPWLENPDLWDMGLYEAPSVEEAKRIYPEPYYSVAAARIFPLPEVCQKDNW